MFNSRMFTLTAVIAMVAMMVFVGCSADEDERNAGIAHDIVDTVAESFAENIVEPALELELAGDFEAAGPDLPDDAVSRISDMIIVASTVYAVHDGGVVSYNLNDKEVRRIKANEKLNAITYHDGKVYVGGENLYSLAGSELELVEAEFIGDITALISFEYRLMIGTEAGLHQKSIFGDVGLLDNVSVTAFAADNSGLWVGTEGQGLYRWNGDEFKKRYLLRDTCIFDFVNSLASKNGHVYVGTDDALYDYDGGKWKTITDEDGLPSSTVLAIDASTWVVYVATEAGVASYHKDEISPVNKLDTVQVNTVRAKGHRLFAGTDNDGLLMKSGPMVKTVVEPFEKAASGELTVAVE